MERRASLCREVAWRSSVCDVLVSTHKVVGLGWPVPGVREWQGQRWAVATPHGGLGPHPVLGLRTLEFGQGSGWEEDVTNSEGAEGVSSQGVPTKGCSQSSEDASRGWTAVAERSPDKQRGAADASCARRTLRPCCSHRRAAVF